MIPAKYWSPTKKLMLLGAMAGGKAVEDTATGNPLTFLTDLARPLKSLSIPFTPMQEGTGDPSPSNIRPIAPWDGLTVKHGGSNLLLTADIIIGKWINGSGATNNDSRGAITSRIEVESSAVYILSYNGLRPLSFAVVELNASGGFIKRNYVDTDQTATDEISFSTSANTKAVICEIYTRDGDMTEAVLDSMKWQFEKGSRTDYNDTVTDTDIVFPSPVYGGTLDVVSGVLTVEWAYAHLTSESNWTEPTVVVSGSGMRTFVVINDAKKEGYSDVMCDKLKPSKTSSPNEYCCALNINRAFLVGLPTSIDTLQKLKDWLDEIGGINIAYPLDTSQEIQLTPQQITALVGNNTLWSDADGQLTAVYFKKG